MTFPQRSLRCFFAPLLLVVIVSTGIPLRAQTPEDFHRSGIEAFRKGDLPAARQALQEGLKQDPLSPALHYNLGLVEYRAGNKGLGIALWRNTLRITPTYSSAHSALKWAESRLPRGFSSRESTLWETFRAMMLVPVPLNRYLGLTAVLLLIMGWRILQYFGERRRALLDERPLPPYPMSATLFSLLWLFSLCLVGAKSYDLLVPRGTILNEKVAVQTIPDSQSASLFDLFEGFEVIVRQSQGDWLQVTHPAGLTGWVPKNSVYLSTDTRIEP